MSYLFFLLNSRRLEKRVLVALPEAEAREVMFVKHLGERSNLDIDFAEVRKTHCALRLMWAGVCHCEVLKY